MEVLDHFLDGRNIEFTVYGTSPWRAAQRLDQLVKCLGFPWSGLEPGEEVEGLFRTEVAVYVS
jgi:hypothetical protein